MYLPTLILKMLPETQIFEGHIDTQFSILYWLNFGSGTKKLDQMTELAVKFDNVFKFIFHPEIWHAVGRVPASLKNGATTY